MIEKLKKKLLKQHDYELIDYKICHEEIKKSKIIIPSLMVFAVVAVLFYTTDLLTFVQVAFAFFIFVLIPLALRNGEVYNVFIVTPKYLIQKTSKSDVVIIEFDNIKKFGTDKTGLKINDSKNYMTLDPTILSEDILVIIDILEAKGKTFDKTKDYMIRPIEIVIKDNTITIKDVTLEQTSTEKLLSENDKDYSMLTPGFINSIILMNSIVEDSHIEDKNLFLHLSRLEVKAGHPENTLFESQMAYDCIMIFENVDISKIIRKEASGHKEEVIEPKLSNLNSRIGKGVISDWKYHTKSIDMQFSVGVHVIKTTFKYQEVIIGWNEYNKPGARLIVKPITEELPKKDTVEITQINQEQTKLVQDEIKVEPVIIQKTESIESPKVETTPEVIEVTNKEVVVKEVSVPVIEKQANINYWKMTVTELKALARERGLKGYSKLKKEELIDILQ